MPLSRQRPPFPTTAFVSGLALFAALTLVFRLTDLDLWTAKEFFSGFAQPWPGRQWDWSEGMYRWGQAPADICGALAWAAFLLSFTSRRWRAWRGPGLYLGLLLLLGPGLLSNVLAKGLAGRPRPVETWGFGGIWEFHRPFQFGIPGRGASFLSGHAANAWYFLGLAFLLKGRTRTRAMALVLAFGSAMCLARVSQGAHWLSDTLLIGAALWSLAAGLSPLIHWQPPASFWRRGPVLCAVTVGALSWFSLSRVVYEERHFYSVPSNTVDTEPTHRDLPAPPPGPLKEMDVDLALTCGDLNVRFESLAPGALKPPFTLDEVFQGQGLPPAREGLTAEPLTAGGQFAPGPRAWAVRFIQDLRGPWMERQDRLRLGLAAYLEIDARLRTAEGAINIGPFPAGRRVLLSGLPAGCIPPRDFHPFGATDWMRDGKAPLISLDLAAPVLRFDQP